MHSTTARKSPARLAISAGHHQRRRGHQWIQTDWQRPASPGITGVVASVGATTSPAVFLKTCMPVQIELHVNGDPAGVPTEAMTMNVADTKVVQADMVDELGAVTPNAPVTILSNNTTVATVIGTTVDGAVARRRWASSRMRATQLRHWDQYADLQQPVQHLCGRHQPQHHNGLCHQHLS